MAEAFEAAATSTDGAVTVLRGGCYGLCELGPNVVVRRRRGAAPDRDATNDRLSLAGGADETVYCGVGVDDAAAVVAAHVDGDAPLVRLTRVVQEATQQPRTAIEERIRALRAARRAGDTTGEGPHE